MVSFKGLISLFSFFLAFPTFLFSKPLDLNGYLRLLNKALSISQKEYDRIWPGYNPNHIPIGLYTDHEAWLINHPNPAGMFKRVEGAASRSELYRSPVRPDQFMANTSLNYNGHLTAILRITDEMPDDRFLELLFHEVFHTFHDSHPILKNRYGNTLTQPFFPLDDLEYYVLAQIEQALLKDACLSSNGSEAKQRIKQHYAVFDLRTGRADRVFRDFELDEQINEGLATYAGHKGLEVMGFKRKARERLDELLAKKTTEPAEFRERCYGTGRALAELLDRFYPEWKKNLPRGFTLLSLLKARVKPESQVHLDKVLQEYQYQKLKEEFKWFLEEARKRRHELRNEVMKPGHLEIIFPGENFIRAGKIQFDPMSISLVSPDLLCHVRMLSVSGDKGFELRSNGQPVISRIKPGNPLQISGILFSLPQDAQIFINQEEIMKLPAKGAVETLAISSKTLSLLLQKAEIESAGGHYLVILRRKEK